MMRRLFLLFLGLVILMLGVMAVGLLLPEKDMAVQAYPDLEVERLNLADEKNAYSYFLQAEERMRKIDFIECWEARKDFINGKGPFTPEIEIYLDQVAEVKELIEKGIATGQLQVPFIEDFMGVFDGLVVYHIYSDLKCLESRRLAESGDIASSMEAIAMIFALGEMIHQEPVNKLQFFVGNNVLLSGMRQAWLLIDSGELEQKKLLALSEMLPTEAEMDAALRFAFKAEFQTGRTIFLELAEAPLSLNRLMKLMGSEETGWYGNIQFLPRMYLPHTSIDLYARHTRTLLESFPENLPEAKVLRRKLTVDYPRGRELWTTPNGIGEMLCCLFANPHRDPFESALKLKGDIAAVRIRLAVEQFRINQGRLPDTHADLVPDYLPSIPKDPMDGEEMRYDAERKLIYSVGTDLKDDGGVTEHLEAENYHKFNASWELKDRIWYFK